MATTHTISNGRIQARFGRTLSLISLKNLLTGTSFCPHGTQSLIVRLPHRVSDPLFLTEIGEVSSSQESLHLALSDRSRRVRAEISIQAEPEGLRFHAKVSAAEPVWLVEWRLAGLDLKEIILPALGGQVLDRQMPEGITLSYKYPFWWNAQFAIGAMKGGGIWLRTKESEPRFKLVRIKRGSDGFTMTYGFEATAPLKYSTLEATWYLDCYRGTWKVPVDIHRVWLEGAFGLTELESHPSFPDWAKEIDFVLEIWGIGKESPEPMHTFDQMIERLKAWAKLHPPARTLVYLPGYAEHGIDSRAPDYNPSEELGGEAGFRKLIDAAHGAGYRVMIHTNALAMTFEHPLFQKFRDYQVVDVFDRTQGWGLDIDGDWLFEPYFAYINPGVKEWGDLMEQVIGDLIRKFDLDGVFLDQTLLAFNVSKGPNFLTGMRDHIARLQKAFPYTLFAGEGMHEQVLSSLPMAQIHGIDSITEIHGAEGKFSWRAAHPVSTYLFGRYTRFTAHLLTKHPSHPFFRLQEAAYSELGVIPALCLYNNNQPIGGPAVKRMIARARRLSRVLPARQATSRTVRPERRKRST